MATMAGAWHVGVPRAGSQPAGGRSLFVWAGDADKRESDFLAVIDADPRSPGYASVVTTLPVGATGTPPHHTDYGMPAGGVLWANGFDSGQTFRVDLRDPARPHPVGSFGAADRPGVDFARERWPHGATRRAIPHGAVFNRP